MSSHRPDNIEEIRLAGLEGFVAWDRTVHAPEHQAVKVAFVSIRVGGVIGINKAAYAMWGQPETVQVMFDPERRRVALRPVDPSVENGYELSWRERQVSAKAMFDFYGVEITHARRYYDLKIIDGVLVIDL